MLSYRKLGLLNKLKTISKDKKGEKGECIMRLEFNKDIGPYTIRSIPKQLFYMTPNDKNEIIELIKSFDTDKGVNYITLAYWVKKSDNYELRFVSDRPFIIENEYILEIWNTLKLAQLTLNEFWNENNEDDWNVNEKLENLKKHINSKSDEELIKDLNEYNINVISHVPGSKGSVNL